MRRGSLDIYHGSDPDKYARNIELFTYSGGSAGWNQKWTFEKVEAGDYSRGISATPEHPDRKAAWNKSESDYDVWPAGAKSNYYGDNIAVRLVGLSATNTIALAQAQVASWVFPNGGTLLNHYLFEIGTPQTLDFKYVNNNWTFAKNRRKIWVNDALEAAEKLAVSGETVTFYSKVEGKNDVPANEPFSDYVLAINSYYTNIKCIVTKTNDTNYQATIHYYMNDIYDFNPTLSSKVGLVSPRDLWELHHGGNCKAFKLSGENKLIVSWTQGKRYDTGANVVDVS